jgi:arylsulfatase A-like enzyme
VLAKLEEHNLSENTLIVFTSDNGTTHGGRDPNFHIGGVDPEFFNSTSGLRGWKGSVYEGGLRVPCIVKWPDHVAPGSTSDAASYFPDWFPTLCSIAGASLPEGQHLDGIDLATVLDGKSAVPRHELMIWDFHNYGGLIAIRDGQWKAVRRNVLKKPTAWELYNIDIDRQESRDLASQHQDIVTRLEAEYIKTRTMEPDFPVPFYDHQSE